MKRKDLEDLIGEDMEDMGLIEHIEERECEDCGHLLEDNNKRSLCLKCQQKQLGVL